EARRATPDARMRALASSPVLSMGAAIAALVTGDPMNRRMRDCHRAHAAGRGAAWLASLSFALCAATAAAQRAGDAERPLSARDAAPIDITGHWVSLITDDWVYRMITPRRGDYSYVPLNDDGRRVADSW